MSLVANQTGLEINQILRVYCSIMDNIADRLDAVAESFAEVDANPGHPNNWKNAEFCYLQIRKCTELVAIALVLMHRLYESDETIKLEQDWKADRILTALAKLNPYCFPFPQTLVIDHSEEGLHHAENDDRVISVRQMKRIFDFSAGPLHAGQLSDVMNQTLQPYDFPKLIELRERFVATLGSHRVMLPEAGLVLCCTLRDLTTGKAHAFLGRAEGPFVIGDDPVVYNDATNP